MPARHAAPPAIALAFAALLFAASCVRKTDEPAAGRLLGDAVTRVPCVLRHDVSYNDLPTASGALSGRVFVRDRACFESVLRAVAATPDFNHGRSTVVYLAGILPDGSAVLPEDFGFPPRPLLRLLRERYAPVR